MSLFIYLFIFERGSWYLCIICKVKGFLENFLLVALKHNNVLLICELPAIRCYNCIK